MKTKSIIATALLFLALSLTLHAQEKYVYAAVTLTGQILSVSSADDFTETKLNKEDFKKSNWGADTGPLLKKVNEMAAQGWEVYNNTDMSFMQATHTITYYLRKKP